MEIKRADSNDLEMIAQSQVLMANETENKDLNIDTVRKGVSFILENPERGFYLVAKDSSSDSPMGCLLVLREWSDWRCKDILWIHSVYVRQEHRGKKVYKKMYQHLKAMVQKNDSLGGLRLYVEKENIKAQKVYEKLGMSDEHYLLYEWLDDLVK